MDQMEGKMQDRFDAFENEMLKAYENGVKDERERCARIVQRYAESGTWMTVPDLLRSLERVIRGVVG